jgi:hypothetical protein
MSGSLRALLGGVVDYAGLFPPAQLTLDQAIRNYARYRTEPEEWMVGRFVCPAARLPELTPYCADLFRSGPPLAISALGRGGNSTSEFLAGLRADTEVIAEFQQQQSGRVSVDVLEVHLPAEISESEDSERIKSALSGTTDLFESNGLSTMTAFFEAPPAKLPVLVSALAKDARSETKQRPPGFKLRCGGVEASAFPSPRMVAFSIAQCCAGDIPLKFTAGLHHPLRHFDPDLKTPIHGFLNLFVAGVLTRARRLNASQTREIVEDENTEDFVFEQDSLHWKDLRASVPAILAARQQCVLSFGSCSFDEPRADLRAMGLL